MDKINKAKIATILEESMVAKFTYLPQQTKGMSVSYNKNYITINSNISSDTFNIICATKTSNVNILREATQIFIDKKLPFAWWTGFNNEPLNLSKSLQKLNLSCNETEIGMAIALDSLPNRIFNSNLNIIQVTDSTIAQDFIAVLQQLMPTDAKAIKKFFIDTQAIYLNEASYLKLFVGYGNNKPIATSCLFYYDHMASIWDVTTLPTCRKMGIGTAMTLYALHEGKRLGCKIGALTASTLGYSVYKKIGFRLLKKFYIWNKT